MRKDWYNLSRKILSVSRKHSKLFLSMRGESPTSKKILKVWAALSLKHVHMSHGAQELGMAAKLAPSNSEAEKLAFDLLEKFDADRMRLIRRGSVYASS